MELKINHRWTNASLHFGGNTHFVLHFQIFLILTLTCKGPCDIQKTILVQQQYEVLSVLRVYQVSS